MGDSLFLAGLILGARALVGLVLVIAGIAKLKAGSDWFLKSLLAYDLVRGTIATTLSKMLPWGEVVSGVLLLVGFLTPFATVFSFLLLLTFTLALTTAIVRDKPVNCGCFGQSSDTRRARWTLVYRNLVLVGLLLPIYMFGSGDLSFDTMLNLHFREAALSMFLQNSLIGIWATSFISIIVLQLLTQRRFNDQRARG